MHTVLITLQISFTNITKQTNHPWQFIFYFILSCSEFFPHVILVKLTINFCVVSFHYPLPVFHDDRQCLIVSNVFDKLFCRNKYQNIIMKLLKGQSLKKDNLERK